MLRTLYFVGGGISLVLGLAGIFLPLLPTTPFLLLSSYCFIRSSPRAHRWLLAHPWFGPPIRDWEEHRAVSRRVKLLAVIAVTGVVGTTWWFGTGSPILRYAILGLATIGLAVVWRLPVTQTRADTLPLPETTMQPEPYDLVA
jgi:hypothetical protein